ncbi:hypothetical protein K9N68_33285 [Kovacikia minuta CCNUW1]|uniref:hypothetical protein n=1 Tax=Kovacikia minuta TaxID=2931930 RepID=UPI001CCF1C10|nr:hypothetical protein [Kovacikia minuta]UBF26321.1 hypothetical protein K9N68_33285 [Kovacikia minuta CCNUW1]
MKFIHPSKSRLARFFVGAFLCLMLFVSSTVPAIAAGSSHQSSPTKGEAKLDQTLEKSQEVLKSPPMSLGEVEDRSNKGLNEVQEDADANKMKRPENTNRSTTVQEKIENALERVTGDK